MVKKTEDTLDTELEPLERRGQLRGLLHGVTAELGDGVIAEVQEASPEGMFVVVEDPESFGLGGKSTVVLKYGELTAKCKAEVVRKEIVPRCGIAFRLTHISPDTEFDYRKILADGLKHRPGDPW